MRLIHAESVELREFMPPNVPPYAILSHTWGEGEVTFQDMSTAARFLKRGFGKIIHACKLAMEEGLEYTWVDTCCIDKSSSAELSESINSMYQWYKEARVCHAYLVDLDPYETMETGLPRCRWFTRGWTLQELLAPRVVSFYNKDWTFRGEKDTFFELIGQITGIPYEQLLKPNALGYASVAEKMSWAARRQTTRVEDTAYCLMGIFDINMPLLYGEGKKAFRRLQEEIIKQSNDLTILAWDSRPDSYGSPMQGVFAPGPEAFADSKGIVPFLDDFPSFSITNKGLVINGDIPLREVVATSSGRKEHLYLMQVGYIRPDEDGDDEDDEDDADDEDDEDNESDREDSEHNLEGGIYLIKVGPHFFHRDGTLPLAGFGRNNFEEIAIYDVSNTTLDTAATLSGNSSVAKRSFQQFALQIPDQNTFALKDARPGTLWNCSNRTFLRPKPYRGSNYPMVIAMKFSGTLAGAIDGQVYAELMDLVVLCDYRSEDPTFLVFSWHDNPKGAAFLFQKNFQEDTPSWEELEILKPEMMELANSTCITMGSQDYHIAASSSAAINSEDVEITKLVLETTRMTD